MKTYYEQGGVGFYMEILQGGTKLVRLHMPMNPMPLSVSGWRQLLGDLLKSLEGE